MVKFLIATHGYLADGFKSSVDVLMGNDIANSIMTINAFVPGGEMDPKGSIEKICSEVNDELVIFTDLMYGSVNQYALTYANKENIYVITGINFPLICEVISKLTFCTEVSKIELGELREIVNKAREQIVFIEDAIQHESNNKEEDFFN